ncbi:hypothetical protein DPMN_163900 [Dreissena polymorpha]|uniref:Uncharacterized protein n=1 Tax=Dreissena polymorpha TaxID=45954 RepID=A0A9D4EU52_DREPO|nr:hypothetical protein DPMN_163900 [Dreissena polymorpha]
MNEAVTEPIEDIQCQSAIICPRVVRIDTLGKTASIPVRVCNVTARPIKIKAKQTLCQLSEVKVLREAQIFQPLNATANPVAASEKENINTNEHIKQKYEVDLDESDLTGEKKTKVYNLFEKWDAIFPKSSLDMGHTQAVKHKIQLLNKEPFKAP